MEVCLEGLDLGRVIALARQIHFSILRPNGLQEWMNLVAGEA
jgi:hypothetical protein